MPTKPPLPPQKKKFISELPDEIREGKHDDRLAEINQAIKDRYEQKKSEVLALVREVYGEDAQIVEGHKSLPDPPSPDLAPPVDHSLGGQATVDPFSQEVPIISSSYQAEDASPAFDGPPGVMEADNPDIESRSPHIMGGPPQ